MTRMRVMAVAAALGAGLAGGCKLPGVGGGKPAEPAAGPAYLSPGEAKQALLVGPDAGAPTPKPELPAREAAKACFAAAVEMEKNGAPEEAVKLYEKARASDPAAYGKTASRRLAVMYDQVGEFSKAAAEYEAALKLFPSDPDLMNDLGYSHYSRGDWAAAVEWLTKATQLKPDHKRAWVNLGLALGAQGKYAESYQAFGKAVKPAEACCNLGFVLAAQGKTEEAKTEYRRASELDPGLTLAKAALAKLDAPKGEKKDKPQPVSAGHQPPADEPVTVDNE